MADKAAFPIPPTYAQDTWGCADYGAGRMGLREWFAGMALQVIAQYPALQKPDELDKEAGVAQAVASWAFEIADAMIEEAAKKK
jgi:hypothetical protein